MHGGKAETAETGIEAVELSNGGKSGLFYLRDTSIFLGFHKLTGFHLVEVSILTNICVFFRCYN